MYWGEVDPGSWENVWIQDLHTRHRNNREKYFLKGRKWAHIPKWQTFPRNSVCFTVLLLLQRSTISFIFNSYRWIWSRFQFKVKKQHRWLLFFSPLTYDAMNVFQKRLSEKGQPKYFSYQTQTPHLNNILRLRLLSAQTVGLWGSINR